MNVSRHLNNTGDGDDVDEKEEAVIEAEERQRQSEETQSQSDAAKNKSEDSCVADVTIEDEALRTSFVIPPMNFATVAPGVYRSGFPVGKNFSFLDELGLCSILCVSPDIFTAELRRFTQSRQIKVFSFNMQANKEPFIGTCERSMVDILRCILDVRNHPMLVHCTSGKHSTGCIIGCLRKLQHWSLAAIFEEYAKYSGQFARLDHQFIELFQCDFYFDRRHAPYWAV
jgi:tyrosine-protein phosphatase SIW14